MRVTKTTKGFHWVLGLGRMQALDDAPNCNALTFDGEYILSHVSVGDKYEKSGGKIRAQISCASFTQPGRVLAAEVTYDLSKTPPDTVYSVLCTLHGRKNADDSTAGRSGPVDLKLEGRELQLHTTIYPKERYTGQEPVLKDIYRQEINFQAPLIVRMEYFPAENGFSRLYLGGQLVHEVRGDFRSNDKEPPYWKFGLYKPWWPGRVKWVREMSLGMKDIHLEIGKPV